MFACSVHTRTLYNVRANRAIRVRNIITTQPQPAPLLLTASTRPTSPLSAVVLVALRSRAATFAARRFGALIAALPQPPFVYLLLFQLYTVAYKIMGHYGQLIKTLFFKTVIDM